MPITTLIRSALLAFVCTAGLAMQAAADAPRRIEVPAGDLIVALKSFAKQTGIEVVYRSDRLAGLKTQGVSGTMPPQEALAKLLEGTRLTLRTDATGAVLITLPRGDDGSTNKSGDTAAPTDAHLVLSETLPAVQGLKAQEGGVEEMLVEGEREKPAPFSTANLDLTRTRDDVLPFQTFTARDIEISGAANLEEFLRMRLPQFVGDAISEEINNVNNTSPNPMDPQNELNLRGWGSGQGNAAMETVILINGRRLPSRFVTTRVDQQMLQGDFRGIPLGAIERIEVLSSAGSAIYGGGATGGVLNVILRQDYRGGQLALNYEATADGLAPRRSADLNLGMPLKWGVGLRLAASIRDSEPLQVQDRSRWAIERWQSLALEREPTRLIRRNATNPNNASMNPFIGATPNIRTFSSAATSNLFGSQGASNFTSVPDGYTGGQGITPFLSRRGVFNIALAEGTQSSSRSRYATLGSELQGNTFDLGLDRNLSSGLRLSLEYRYSTSETTPTGGYFYNVFNGGRPVFTVPGAATNNPFGVDVMVNFDDPRMQRPEIEKSSTNTDQQLSAVLRAEWGAWRGLLDASYSENEGQWDRTYFYAPIGGWTSALISGAYNPFVDMRVASPAAPSFYENFVLFDFGGDTASNNRAVAGKLSGPLWQLPAGPVRLTTGAEWSQQKRTSGNSRVRYVDNVTGAPLPFITGDPIRQGEDGANPPAALYTFENYGFYGEASVPVLDPEQEIPLARHLELFASARLDYALRNGYTAAGALVKYDNKPYTRAFGLRQELFEGLTLRASRSIGFRPPSMDEVTPSAPPTAQDEVNDPLRGETVDLLPTQYLQGGNPDIRPMTTTSTNFGVVLQPQWIRGLRLSLDYLENIRIDTISGLFPQQTVDLEAVLPGRVQRGAPDGDPSGVGPIIFVDARNVNFRQMASKSLDLAVDQQLGEIFGGRLLFTAVASKLISFKVQFSNDTPPEEQVRNPGASFSRAIQWNGNAQLRWESPVWSLGWSARYLDQVLAAPSDYILLGSDRANWAMDHSLFVGYRMPKRGESRGMQWLLSGTSMTLGVKNVFDRKPRFWAASTSGYLGQDSLMGRSVWLQVRKSFD